MVKPKPRVQCNALRPSVFTKDVEAAASFYIDKLGFKRDFSWGEPVQMVGVKLGNVLIFLEAGTPHPATTWLFFIVGNADALYEFQQAQGVDVGEAPTNQPYGYRTFHVKDPWGNNLQFGHPLEEESTPANVDLDSQPESCRWAAHHAQTRYGLLVATYERINLLQERFPGKQVYNSTVLQPFNDSFDMLVIDLCSAAKAWLDKDNGLFKLLAQKPDLLRRRSANDFGDGEGGRVADSVNRAISKLVPDENPVGPDGIRRLRERFRVATECVNNDRNWVRAHRYEKTRAEGPPSDHAIPLSEYVQHVEYLIEHIYQACLAITAISFDTGIKVPHGEAADWPISFFTGRSNTPPGPIGLSAELRRGSRLTSTMI